MFDPKSWHLAAKNHEFADFLLNNVFKQEVCAFKKSATGKIYILTIIRKICRFLAKKT